MSSDDCARLSEVMMKTRSVGPGEDLLCEGDRPDVVHLFLSGWGLRYKRLANGKRQILSVLLPGDFCDLHVAILRRIDHSIGVLSEAEIVEIPRSTVETLTTRHPTIARALWWATLVDEGVVREWLVNVGQRTADRALIHFFCEVFTRLQVVELVRGMSYELPLTQQDLGDVLGLSTVHVNRTLAELRSENMFSLRNGVLQILDEQKMIRFSGFKDNYLHLYPELCRQ